LAWTAFTARLFLVKASPAAAVIDPVGKSEYLDGPCEVGAIGPPIASDKTNALRIAPARAAADPGDRCGELYCFCVIGRGSRH
jgi:hypothetical protein